jgi:hypothetical protein
VASVMLSAYQNDRTVNDTQDHQNALAEKVRILDWA